MREESKELSINFLKIFKKLIPFWVFLALFKFGGGLHFTVLAPLGEKVFPIWLVGIFIGLSALIQVALDVPAGHILDRFGYKKLLKITTAFFILASLCLTFGLTQLTFILTLFVSTFGWLFFGPGTTAYIAKQSSNSNIGKLTSAKDVFASIGIVLSSAAIIFILALEVNVIGYFLTAILILTYIAISLSPEEPSNSGKHERAFKIKKSFLAEAYQEIVRLRPVSIIMIITGFSAAMFYAIIWFVVPLLIAEQLDNGILGLGLGIFDFAVVVLGFFLGRMVDTFDKKLLILLGLFLFAVCGILIGFNFGILFLFLGFFATAGDELSGLALWAWLYNMNKDKSNYGLIAGVIGLFEDIGWAIGPIAAGFLYMLIGPTWTIALGGILIFINIIIFFLAIRNPLPGNRITHPVKHHYRKRHKH